MTRDEWREVDAAVADALELDAPDRAAFLQQRLGGRDHLIREASSLLAYSDQADEPMVVAPENPWIGRHVGAYRIIELAGEGGMGVVWAAERADGQFERRVAVKFLATLFPSSVSLERFLRERDILARLDHSNIARLLDAGVADETQPYLVMEWVDGTRVDDYCRALDIPRILGLFRQVCDAVEYAHRRLVTHRDIKSANLLVTPQGQVKLLDFGIAQFGDPELAGRDRTAPIARVLTPEYASPEHLRGDPVTTSTDVYSLGVVLYELLAGNRPFHFEGKTLADIVANAGRAAPPRPSSLRPSIPAELDAIVLKAMRAEPVERYGSAAELAADIDHFLGGRPVRARPAGALYVASKFVRRNRLAVAGATVAILLIAASAVIATRQRIQAERRFSQLRQLAHSVIFEFQDDISRLHGTLEVRRRMVARSLEYLDSLAAESRGDPQLLLEVAKGYDRLGAVQGKHSIANLGDFSGGLTSIRKARAALEELLRRRPNDFDAQCTLGDVLFDMSVIQQRVNGEDAQATLNEGVGWWEKVAKQYPDRERALRGLASAKFFSGDLEGALVLYQKLDARNEALVSRMLAARETDDGRARRLIDRAIEIDTSQVAAKPRDRLSRLDLSFDLSMLGNWHKNRNETRAALGAFEKVLEIREQLVNEDARDEQAKDRLLFVLCEMGQLHLTRQEYL